MIPTVHCTLDDRPIDLARWFFSADLGGWAQARGRITEKVSRRVEEGSILRAYVGDDVKWAGKVPHGTLAQDGVAELAATGFQEDLLAVGRLLYQSRDIRHWMEGAGKPFEATTQNNFSGATDTNCLRVSVADTLISDGTKHAFIASCLGSPGGFSRVRMSYEATTGSLFDLEVHVATYPHLGGVPGTFVDSDPLGLSGAIDFDLRGSVTTERTQVYLVHVCNLEHAPDRVHHWLYKDLVLNGITYEDVMTTSAIVSDMCSRAGFDTSRIRTSGLNALPFDVIDMSWQAALFYLAALDGWHPPRVLDRAVEYGPWGEHQWTVSLARNARPELVPLGRYNRVRVAYQRQGSNDDEVIVAADPDPLVRRRLVKMYNFSLQDVQGSDSLAKAVGRNLVQSLSQKHRVAGRIRAVDAKDQVGRGTIFDCLPGDEVVIQDWGPSESFTLPVHGWEIAEGEPAVLGISMEPSVTGLVSLAQLAGMRHSSNAFLPALDPIPLAPALQEAVPEYVEPPIPEDPFIDEVLGGDEDGRGRTRKKHPKNKKKGKGRHKADLGWR